MRVLLINKLVQYLSSLQALELSGDRGDRGGDRDGCLCDRDIHLRDRVSQQHG